MVDHLDHLDHHDPHGVVDLVEFPVHLAQVVYPEGAVGAELAGVAGAVVASSS